MITRRNWMRQAAGVTAVAAIPQLTRGRGLAQIPGNGKAITGAGSLKAHAAARGLLTGCAVNANLFREDEGFRKLLAEQYNIAFFAMRDSFDKAKKL
jgi:endo-1,4-beta-xylanase